MNKILKKQFAYEREARKRILNSSTKERFNVMKQVYDYLFQNFPDSKATKKGEDKKLKHNLLLCKPFLNKKIKFLEIGCGKGTFIRHLAEKGFNCTGIDLRVPEFSYPNLKLVESNAVLPELNEKFDLIFSFHVIEHFHPDDVKKHLECIHSLLNKNGKCIICLPNSIIGPGDISRLFGCKYSEALHLKEWMYSEFYPLIKNAGFQKATSFLIDPRLTFSKHFYVPINIKLKMEALLRNIPPKIRRPIGKLLAIDIYLILE